MTVGESIARLREQSGMTQKELAGLLFVSPDTVYRWESGVRRPAYYFVRLLADIFGVEPREIADTDAFFSDLAELFTGGESESDLSNLINSFLAELPDRERNVFVMRYYFFLDTAEIAEKCFVSEPNVRKLLSRTVKKLKNRSRRDVK